MTEDILNIRTMKNELLKRNVDIDAFVAVYDSTQTYAKESSVAKDTVFVAISQNSGIGRLGRSFSSGEGGCYFSLVTFDNKNPLHNIPVISVSIATLLREYNVDAVIKWPNDILVKGKKISGTICSSHNGRIIIGVGINHKNDISDISDIATSLTLEGVNGKLRAEIIAEIIAKFYEYKKEPFEVVLETYKKYFCMTGKEVSVNQGGGIVKGRIKGLDDEGFLILETAEGNFTVYFGDVNEI